MNLFLQLIPNLTSKFNYVIYDFVGFSINLSPLMIFISNFIFAIFLIFISYLLGKKILLKINSKELEKYTFLISIALGYILIATGLTFLGVFSLFKSAVLFVYFFFVILIAIYPLDNLVKEVKFLKENLISTFLYLKKNKLVFTGTCLFVLVATISLINPEIREDQYHIDFPRLYIAEETTMIQPRLDLLVSGSSMLSEMYYIPGVFLLSKESARYIHFSFYILVILSILEFTKLNKHKFAIYAPIIFVTAPVVIHETSSMYVDFQWIFLFLLSALLLIQKHKFNHRVFLLIGILLGGMLATKLWTIVLIPILFLFILLNKKKYSLDIFIKRVFLIAIGIILVSVIWFIRAYLLTGNLFFPANQIQDYFTFNKNLINPIHNLNVFSILFFLGITFIFFDFKNNLRIIKNNALFKLLTILFLSLLFLNYPYGRYLLSIYILFIFLASLGLYSLIKKFYAFKLALFFLILGIFSYYFISSILVLPYAFGISDKNEYLSRILVRDNSSFYDFDRKFNKYISKKDKVAMYNFHGYYYVDFDYVDINFLFDKDRNSINSLGELGTTKLMIRGGDLKWFCNKLLLKDCEEKNYNLISKYSVYPYYYLYKIK